MQNELEKRDNAQKAFATRLRELRDKAEMTQEQLGQEIGVSGQTISNWENQLKEAGQTNISLIADFFNVTADYLMGRTNARNKGNVIAPEKILPEFTQSNHKGSYSPKQVVEEEPHKTILNSDSFRAKKRK